MEFDNEAQAFDRQMAKIDLAFRKGAFGLAEAIEVVDDYFTLRSLFQSGDAGILSRLVQFPLSQQTNDEMEGIEQEEEVEADQAPMIPGTDHSIAIQKAN